MSNLRFSLINIGLILIVIEFAVGIFLGLAFAGNYFSHKSDIVWGVYDPQRDFASNSEIGLEHIFWGWKEGDYSQLESGLKTSSIKNRKILVTVEPWTFDGKLENYYKNIREQYRYQKIIRESCQIISKYATNSPIYLRWGHEVDLIDQNRYPWANGDKQGFIDTYRSITNTCRDINPNIKTVWSPSGNDGSNSYYPGDSYVDIIGVSLYSNPEWEITQGSGKPRSFEELFGERYARLKDYKKDIWIAEGGVAKNPNDSQYQANWLKKALALAKNPFVYPNLKGFIYFNATDPFPWKGTTNKPDFKITPESFPAGVN
jgi:endoglucanase